MFLKKNLILQAKRRRGVLCIAVMIVAVITAIVQAAPQETPSECGKYPNSMLVRTRTASTYPGGLRVFTLVAYHQDFTQKRNPKTGDMEILADGDSRWQTTSVWWAEYGITDRFQVGVSLPFINRRYKNEASSINQSEYGIGDASLYAKYRLVNETRYLPAIAVDGFFKMPTGDKKRGLGNDEYDSTLAMEFSKRFKKLSFHVNPEYTITGGSTATLGDAADNKTSLNLGIMYHATKKLIPMLESNSWWWGDYGRQSEVGGGVLWFPTKNTSIKVVVSVPVSVDMPWASDWMPWVKLAVWF